MSDLVVAMETVSEERLAEILAGLEGVTPGPWGEGDHWVFVPPLSGQPHHALENVLAKDKPQANAAHIARLDPETVRSIISELIASRLAKQAPDGDPVLRFAEWQHEGDALASAVGCTFTLKVKSPNSTWMITSRPAAPSPVGGSVS